MARNHRPSLLLPSLILKQVRVSPDEIVTLARSRQQWAACPACGGRSGHVHSRYERHLLDFPAHGRRVWIRLIVRRFRCRVTSEPYIFKTPHHPDYKRDGRQMAVDVGLATAAAPTVYKAIEKDGYVLADGGIWANNPIMVGVVDALACFLIDRRQLHVLSLGTGRTRLRMGR